MPSWWGCRRREWGSCLLSDWCALLPTVGRPVTFRSRRDCSWTHRLFAPLSVDAPARFHQIRMRFASLGSVVEPSLASWDSELWGEEAASGRGRSWNLLKLPSYLHRPDDDHDDDDSIGQSSRSKPVNIPPFRLVNSGNQLVPRRLVHAMLSVIAVICRSFGISHV